jgi:hypothetical protein
VILAAALTATLAASSCATTTERLFKTYVEAYNKGDAARLDRAVFAREPAFQWYSDARRRGPEAQQRSTLRAYFAARHRAGDRFSAIRFKNNAYRASDRTQHFEYTLKRDGKKVPGKGAASCPHRRIIVMSLGG